MNTADRVSSLLRVMSITLLGLSAVPMLEPGAARQRIILKGDVPSPINPPKGCRFHTRCPYVFDRCKVDTPKLVGVSPGHGVSCHLVN